jgi:hypothetical protein
MVEGGDGAGDPGGSVRVAAEFPQEGDDKAPGASGHFRFTACVCQWAARVLEWAGAPLQGSITGRYASVKASSEGSTVVLSGGES